jgi:hypothetical protein
MARRGVGLFTVLVALLILSFVLIPLMSAFHGSRLGAEKSINYLIAANLITSQIEAMRARPFRELESYILGLKGTFAPRQVDFLNGPFEASPEIPDVVDKGVFKTGDTTFDRYTFIAYFPVGNPDPGRPDTFLMRQRIRVRVDVLWKERFKGTQVREARQSASTLVQNENFNPRPGYVPLPGGPTP